MSTTYEDRIRRVLRYIHDNPDGDLSLDRLADIAAFSRLHFHRVFHAMTGETTAQAVRRVRCYRASVWLATTNMSIADIADRIGYANEQSFMRAFRSVFGKTPNAFRKTDAPGKLSFTLRVGDKPMTQVDIKPISDMRLASLHHEGPYPNIGKTFEQLVAIFSSRDLWPHAQGTAAVYYDDPSAVPEAELRSVAGVVVDASFDMPKDLSDVLIESGDCAVLRYKGPYSGLPAAWERLYGEWLPASGREPADRPPFEVYLNSPLEVAPEELLTEICVPLR